MSARAGGGIMLKLATWLVALTVVALPLIGVVNGWFGANRWPITKLEIEAAFDRLNAEQITGAVAKHSGAGFFAIKLDAVRASLEKLPGVESVEVRKRWPDTLVVRVAERHAVASWPKSRLVGEDGTLFGPFEADFSAGLPALSGPDDRAAEVLEFYRAATLAMRADGLTISSLTLSERGSWELALESGGVVAVGRDDPSQRLERFLTAWPRLPRPPGSALQRADLRYANGFAIQWTTPTASPPPVPPTPPTATPPPTADPPAA